MNDFIIESNYLLSRSVEAFYSTDYVGYGKEGNPDYINTLKNIYSNQSSFSLQEASAELEKVLTNDLHELNSILKNEFPNEKFTVCAVPRSKVTFINNQLYFRQTISKVVDKLKSFDNGVDYIQRVIDTRTTHMKKPTANFDNSGESPYPGIALDTCTFSSEIEGKNILLIDDIYTKTINIDEDFIEALYKKGAKNVIFYAIGKTAFNRYY